MPNRNYLRGSELETKLVKHLIKVCKWPYARRTPGSKSPVDVLGITPFGVTVMFQCKSTEKDSYDLTSLTNSVSVFRLKQIPDSVEKILLIKIGFKHTTEYHFYKWDKVRNAWMGNLDYNFKDKTEKENK